MAKLSELMQAERTISVPFGGDGSSGASLQVTYRPGGVTPAFQAKARELSDPASLGDQLANMLPDVVCGWDLENEDGTPVAINESRLRHVPLFILTTVFMAITDDLRGGTADEKKG